MKKLFLVLFVFLAVVSFCYANINKWEKVGENIFIDKSSVIKKEKYTAASFKIQNVDGSYTIEQYEASCDETQVLKVIRVSYYDKNNNLIKSHINDCGNSCAYSSYEGIENGSILYHSICKSAK